MKYYSEKTNKLYESAGALEVAEKELADKEAEKAKLSETKKIRAKEVEDAYKEVVEARKKARDIIREADDKYNELKNKFVEDFGSYHMTYSAKDGKSSITVDDLIDSFFGSLNDFPFIW